MMVLAMLAMTPAFKNGNQLYSECLESVPVSCGSYIMGVSDLIDSIGAQGIKTVCTSPAVTFRQVRDVVIVYIRDHPAVRDKAAASLVRYALEEAFPCSL